MQKKQAQSQIYEDLLAGDVMSVEDVPIVSEQHFAEDNNNEEVVLLEFEDPKEQEIVFILPEVPGAPDAEEIILEEDDDEDIEVKDDEQDVEVEAPDPWNWQAGGLENYLPWLYNKMSNPPTHTGYDTTGLEKAIAYYQLLDKTVPKAMRADINNVIDSRKAEEAREQIYDALDRLTKRLDQVSSKKYKKNKKSWAENSGMVKEAQSRTANIVGITITVPLIISRCARVCINGMVSAGHDIEELYHNQVKEYSLDKVQQAELAQLLSDMGYPMRQDRGFAVGTHVDTTRSDNRDWAANYQS